MGPIFSKLKSNKSEKMRMEKNNKRKRNCWAEFRNVGESRKNGKEIIRARRKARKKKKGLKKKKKLKELECTKK